MSRLCGAARGVATVSLTRSLLTVGPGPGWCKPGSGGVACFCAFGPVSCVCVCRLALLGGLELHCTVRVLDCESTTDVGCT